MSYLSGFEIAPNNPFYYALYVSVSRLILQHSSFDDVDDDDIRLRERAGEK